MRDQDLLGYAIVRFETFIAQRKLTKDKIVTLPLMDEENKQVSFG